jgi:hypothetical protein
MKHADTNFRTEGLCQKAKNKLVSQINDAIKVFEKLMGFIGDHRKTFFLVVGEWHFKIGVRHFGFTCFSTRFYRFSVSGNGFDKTFR